MMPTALHVAAPRLLTIKNRQALLHHVLDRVDEGARDVVLDLANTRYVDSSGLALLADLQRVLVREMNGRLRVSGACPELRLLLHATRLDTRLELVDHLPDPTLSPAPWHAPEVTTEPALA
jgi:anti-anti-sigma factor